MSSLWLPLNGDLHNQGISSIIATGINISVNTAGKIGSCYSFNGSSSYIELSSALCSNDTTEFSYACWVKFNSTASCCLFSNRTTVNSNGVTLFVNNSGNILYDIGNERHIKTYSFSTDTWYHLAFTYKKGATKKIYVNGTEIYSAGTSGTMSGAAATKSFIGASQNTSTTVNANYLNGYLNDVRIWNNHCLSAAEVKEISQGLVLHYKLDTMRVSSGTNLVTGVTKGGQTTVLTDGRIGVQTSGVNADTYFRLNLSENITAGTSYLLSCDASGISEGQYWNFPVGAQSNSGTLNFKIINGHNVYAFTANATKSDGTTMDWGTNQTLMLDDNYRGDALHPACFYNFKLFKIGQNNTTIIVEDSSGYNNNGIINGNMSINSNTAKYSNAIVFNGSDNAIKIPFNDIIKTDDYTISVWTYKETIGTKSYQTILGGPSGFELEARSGSSTSPLYRIHNWGGGTTAYEFNKWNLFTFVRTASDSKLYVNGELKLTGTAGTIPTGDYFIGAWSNATKQNYEGLMSDFRIYCTPLLDTDIKQLYNVGMKVDKTQNIHNFELVEKGYNILAATPWCSSYSTHNPITSPFTNFNANGEVQFTANGSSAGTNYLEITPGIYEYDYTISVNTGNQFYIGFERYDADKTSRSNNACVYTYSTKPSADVIKQRYKGTVNLSTDGTNPLKYIALRILNGWSGTTSGVTGQATIHNFSLRLKSVAQNPKITKVGQLISDEFKEYTKASFYKDHIVEANQFIER